MSASSGSQGGSRTRVVVAVVVAAVVVVAAAVGGWLWFGRTDEDPFAGAPAAAEAYASAWSSGDLASVSFAGAVPGAQVADEVAGISEGLAPAVVGGPTATVVSVVPDPEDDSRGTATVGVSWNLSTGGTWAYEVTTPLVKEEKEWRVDWSPGAVEPSLVAGEVLEAELTAPERGTILDGSGAPIFRERPVVHVGIVTPKEGVATPTAEQLAATATTVADVVGVDGDSLRARVAAAPADQFVEVITLRRERYDEVRSQIYDLPGTAFRQDTLLLAPSAGFARELLGTVGEATAEDIESSDGAIRAGQLVGHGGLQEAYDDRLAGTDGVTVRAVAAPEADPSSAPADTTTTTTAAPTAPDGTTSASPSVVPRDLFAVAPVAGQSIQVSIDPTLQTQAEAALATNPKASAMVVVRPSTGQVLAVANGGTEGPSYNRAFEGRYPPGSTFKVVSTFALLTGGLTPDEPVDCPPSLNVGGRSFVNAESHELGSVPFRVDFAESCNTAFVGLSDRVTDAQLAEAGTALGLSDQDRLGVPAFFGDVPASDDAVGHAAAMIGQGKVLASPLGLSVVAASVANGTTISPVLVTDPVTGAVLLPDGSEAAPAGPGAPLDPTVVATLQQLMGEVVTSGTATVLANVPGEPVHAKTGTAEFGTEDPPRTHAWMIGYRGDLAFAVLVEDGGFGAQAAGPIAAQFLGSVG